MKILEKYYTNEKMMLKCHWSIAVLKIVESDINKHCEPYNNNLTYAGRGNSSHFSLSEFLVPELGINPVFYIHDSLYTLVELNILGYTKEFADDFMKNLMEMEGFDELANIYFEAVKRFG